VGRVARVGEMRRAYKILIGKPEWKRQVRRLRYGWEDNIRLDLSEIGWVCNEHSGSIKDG